MKKVTLAAIGVIWAAKLLAATTTPLIWTEFGSIKRVPRAPTGFYIEFQIPLINVICEENRFFFYPIRQPLDEDDINHLYFIAFEALKADEKVSIEYQVDARGYCYGRQIKVQKNPA